MMELKTKKQTHASSEDHWIPFSDLMTGLMMVFMLIAITFMIQVKGEENKAEVERDRATTTAKTVTGIAEVYLKLRENLYNDLVAEFSKEKWGATIERDLTIRFSGPDIMFESGAKKIPDRFSKILDEFVPRYIKILSSPAYKDSIEEIRIEGHTSSKYVGANSADEAYIKNMELSQDRTRSVLGYINAMQRPTELKKWLISHLTANGLSSSKLRLNIDGSENESDSRRVEFRLRTNAENRISDILKSVTP